MYATASFEKQNLAFICVGSSSQNDGGGSVEVDDSMWKTEVLRLMRGARIIIVVPSPSPGSWWELQTIVRERILSKCAFVQPPSSDRLLPDTDDELLKDCRNRIAAEWTEVMQSCQTIGIDIPHYDPWGQLFRITPDRGMLAISPFLLRNIFRGNRFAEAVLILFE